MTKKIKNTKRDLLNKISGYVVIVLGVVFLYYSLSTFGKEISLFFPIVNSLSSVALIFLGVYVLRVEKWAIILAGVYGVASLINGWWMLGLFSGFRGVLFDISHIVLIINWWISNKNDK